VTQKAGDDLFSFSFLVFISSLAGIFVAKLEWFKNSQATMLLSCLCKSRHTVVCRAAQENGAHANEVSILTGTTKSRFSRICSYVIPYLNGTKFAVKLASTQGRPDFKF